MSEISFFYFPGSAYTYLTVNRIEARAREAGVTVRWRPYNLRLFLRESGTVPFPSGSSKERYMWRDLERRARRLNVPYTSPPPYPVDPDLKALRVAKLAALEGWAPEFMKAHYRAWFLDGKPPGVGTNTEYVLVGLGHDPQSVLARAEADEVTKRIDSEVAEARRLGLFGSPHFIVGDEVFWGDDRLEEALAWAKNPTQEQPLEAARR